LRRRARRGIDAKCREAFLPVCRQPDERQKEPKGRDIIRWSSRKEDRAVGLTGSAGRIQGRRRSQRAGGYGPQHGSLRLALDVVVLDDVQADPVDHVGREAGVAARPVVRLSPGEHRAVVVEVGRDDRRRRLGCAQVGLRRDRCDRGVGEEGSAIAPLCSRWPRERTLEPSARLGIPEREHAVAAARNKCLVALVKADRVDG
jgi:hypothetical protein